MMQEIQNWIELNKLDVAWTSDSTFKIDDKNYLYVRGRNGKAFSSDFELILPNNEPDDIDFYCFQFGERFYYTDRNIDKVSLNELKYIGKAKEDEGFAYLGVHGGYELCSGSKSYEDWCQKAKFLSIQALGLAEKHTLAGAIKFQQACLKAGIKPIIGETVTVRRSKANKEYYDYSIKLYVSNYEGWRNLLRIHKRLNIDNASSYVEEAFLSVNSKGLYCVFQADTDLNEFGYENTSNFEGIYFQFDPSEYKSKQRDLHILNCLKTYLSLPKNSRPTLALICDSYYLNKEDAKVKKILQFIGGGKFAYQSEDQYFKSQNEVLTQCLDMFESKGDAFALEIYVEAVEGLNEIVEGCNFQIKMGEVHLPKYELSDKEKEQGFRDSEELFWHLINKGLEEKVISKGKNVDEYLERIEREVDVIKRGGFIDYFLITRDYINWSEYNNNYVGTGRGSIGGSIVAYMLGITKVDAIEYGLIFERFLNEARIGKGMPDIDTDFENRDEVKRYLESRYGQHNVCSIGTYTTLQIKAAFNDVLRFHGEQSQNIKYHSVMMRESNDSFETLFTEASTNDKIKVFIQDHYDAIEDIPLILGQPKSSSVHAAGIVITPKSYNEEPMQIYDWFPVKLNSGVLVSEWEGPQLEAVGFLKADVLGLKQLENLHHVVNLIKENRSIDVDLNSIPLNDEKVFELFKEGINQDVFQFGTDGLSAYCKEVKPESVEELAIINALYRPGSMDSGAHMDYIKIKFGRKEAEYDWGCEEIMKETNGLLIYQESTMKICQVVGGFSLTESEFIRKSIGKKLIDKIKEYGQKFIDGAVKNGCSDIEAYKIWNKIEGTATYQFNKSHAVAYSIIGYQCQYLKCHYPLEFFTSSLEFAKNDDVPKRISEIRKFPQIKLSPPDINKSREVFFTDFNKNTIYWSLLSITQVGEAALKGIMQERDLNGKFFSIEEFVKRTKGKKVNKKVVKHLVLSGCFDELYKIEYLPQRLALMEEWAKVVDEDLDPEYLSQDAYKEFFWFKKQRELSGFGFFDYSKLDYDLELFYNHDYIEPEQMVGSEYEQYNVYVSGILVELVKRKTRKGEMCKLVIDHNSDLVNVVLWNDAWMRFEDEVSKNVNSGIVVSGQLKYDSYNKKNVIYSTENTKMDFF